MIEKVFALLPAWTNSSAACALVGFSWPARARPPASVGATGGSGTPQSTTTLALGELAAWLSMQGVLTVKESK